MKREGRVGEKPLLGDLSIDDDDKSLRTSQALFCHGYDYLNPISSAADESGLQCMWLDPIGNSPRGE